jgi:hypothetical protein
VRAPTHVVSTICDDRGEEPTYYGVTMSELITGDYGIGDVLALLWFKRKLPKWGGRAGRGLGGRGASGAGLGEGRGGRLCKPEQALPRAGPSTGTVTPGACGAE